MPGTRPQCGAANTSNIGRCDASAADRAPLQVPCHAIRSSTAARSVVTPGLGPCATREAARATPWSKIVPIFITIGYGMRSDRPPPLPTFSTYPHPKSSENDAPGSIRRGHLQLAAGALRLSCMAKAHSASAPQPRPHANERLRDARAYKSRWTELDSRSRPASTPRRTSWK